MAGLFDYEDPRSVGNLAFAGGLLNAGGPQRMPVSLGQALAQAFAQRQGAAGDVANEMMRRKLMQSQITETEAQAEQRRQAAIAAQAEALRKQRVMQYLSGVGQTTGLGAFKSPVVQQFNLAEFMRAGGTAEEAKKYLEASDFGSPKYGQPIPTEDNTLVQFPDKPGYKPIPSQYKGRPQVPAAVVSVNTDKSLWGNVGEGFAKDIVSVRNAAQNAPVAIDNAQRLLSAVQSGQAIVGPAATPRLIFEQVGVTFFGKDPDRVVKTRQAIQSLATMTLDSRKALGGQGSVSDFEQRTLEKASSGQIDDMTGAELQVVANTAIKLARRAEEINKRNMEAASRTPGAAPLTPFFPAPALSPEPSAASPGRVIDFKDLPRGGR